MIEFAPQPGPQEQFAACRADIAIMGGSAGGGKSWGIVAEPARWFDVPGFNAILFRRHSTEVRGGGGLWDESQALYRALGGMPKEHMLEWKFPSGARIEFSHLQYDKDVHSHHGRQYALIGFDELTTFTEHQFWYMLSRLRSTCGVKPYVRATCNPDPDSFVRRLISWWIGADGFAIPERSGAIRWLVRQGDDLHWFDSKDDATATFAGQDPLSITFIRSKLDDNPALLDKDPRYRSRLEAMPRVERERLLEGNWDTRAHAGDYFRRSMFEVVDAAPPALKRVRAWDRAGTKPSAKNSDPDWTVGVLASKAEDGTLYIEHAEMIREDPTAVDATQARLTTVDGKQTQVAVWQDPGAAGKAEIAHIRRRLHGYDVHSEVASKNKVTYATPVSSLAGAGVIKIVRGAWNEQFLRQLEAFPDGAHDDAVDALSLASLCLEAATPEIYLV